jgi:hypothetical protein
MLDGVASLVLIWYSWRPDATIYPSQGGLRVQSYKVLGLPARCCLQRSLHRQTARLRDVICDLCCWYSFSTATLKLQNFSDLKQN